MTFEFATPQNVICNNAIGKVISQELSELANIIKSSYTNLADYLDKMPNQSLNTLQVTRINSEESKANNSISNPISQKHYSTISTYEHIVKSNDVMLQDEKINLEEIFNQFGDLRKVFHKNLEKGNYCSTVTNHYLVSETVYDDLGVEKQLEFTYDKGELLVYSYTELKKDKNGEINYYKFVNFTDDGKSVINSTENYVLNNQRLEVKRDFKGRITELIEESGLEVNAFYVNYPTHLVKKDKYGNVIEYREYRYDSQKRNILAKIIKNDTYYLIENEYQDNFVISNYKNIQGNTYWTRVFNNKIKRHVIERLFDNDGNIIREEVFSYNKYGDLTLRVDKDSSGKTLSSKEIKYNIHNSPVLIINRGKNGIIESEIEVA